MSAAQTPAPAPSPAADRARLVRSLAELVALDTTSSRSNQPLVDLVAPRLERAGFRLERQRYRDDAGVEKVNVVAVKGGRAGQPPALALVGHTDCVPFDPAWKEALTLTERDGRLYGRGACDTKAFIACALSAAEAAGEVPGGLMVVLTADEEVGCVGAKRMVEARLGVARKAIVGEPTSLRPIRGHKGYCLAEVEVVGQEGHSAFPDTGRNAIFHAGRFLTRLEALARGKLQEQQDPAFSPPYTTVNVGLISGGKAKNVIAGSCRFFVEWRPIPGQPPGVVAGLLEDIRQELVREDPGFTAELRVVRSDVGVQTPPGAEVVRWLEAQTGNASDTVPFGTELPYLTQLGAESVVFGPGDIRVAHQTGEYVPVDELLACEAYLRKAVAQFCG